MDLHVQYNGLFGELIGHNILFILLFPWIILYDDVQKDQLPCKETERWAGKEERREGGREGEGERERQTDRQTDREREGGREGERE